VFHELTYHNVIQKGLNVMDMTAFTLCKENNLPIIVFDMNEPGNLSKVIDGEQIGTLVH
jgi:uridylate kinase